MDCHLDRKVVLSKESEFKSLYSWSLQELDDEGKKIGRDQTLWQWSLYFTATELTYSETLSLEGGSWEEITGGRKPAAAEKKIIRGKLRPGRLFESEHRRTNYSMFGTSRTIKEFDISIVEVDGAQSFERCELWGGVSYTTEIDFRNETVDDAISIYFHVSPERFAHYLEMLTRSAVDIAIVRLSAVSGFYSEWSPAISTDHIKVLTNLNDHGLEIPEDATFKPPVLGPVGTSEITFLSSKKLRSEIEEASDARAGFNTDAVRDAENTQIASSNPLKLQEALVQIAMRNEGAIRRLSWGIWIAALLLAVLVLRR